MCIRDRGFSACPTVACSISTIFSAVKTSLTGGTDRGLYISSICSAFCSITKLESCTASLRPSYNFARHSFVLVTTLFSAGSKNERLLSTVGLIDSKIRNYKKTLFINFESVLRQILVYYQCKCQEFRLFYIKGKTVDSWHFREVGYQVRYFGYAPVRKIYNATTFLELRCFPNQLRDLLGLHDCFVCRNGPYALLRCAGWVCKSISVCRFNPKK